MRFSLLALALAGILVSFLSLARHYDVDDSTAHYGLSLSTSAWDSSAVNHSRYAVAAGIPVAAFGIVGYALLGILAYHRLRELTAVASLLGLAYAMHLTNIEAHILGLWCVYCVVPLILITMIVFLAFAELIAARDQEIQ